MPNSWFRLYAEIRRDPKVQTMPETFQLRLIWLFTLRCEGPTERLSIDELGYGLGCNAEITLDKLHETFLSKGFIEEDWSVVNWDKRQYVSDSSTERVRKFRENQSARTLKQDETFHVTDVKQDETQNETHQNRAEQSRTEQRKKIPTPKSAFVLPESIPLLEWNAWLEVRKKKRASPTNHAMELAVKKLIELQARGFTPKEVLNEAVLRNWTGIFEPHSNGNGGSNGHEDRYSRLQRKFEMEEDEVTPTLPRSPGIH